MTKVDDCCSPATYMQLMRGMVFGLVSLLPAFMLGTFAYILMGGNWSQDVTNEDFLVGPCYLIPGLIVGGSLFLGLRDEGEVKQ